MLVSTVLEWTKNLLPKIWLDILNENVTLGLFTTPHPNGEGKIPAMEVLICSLVSWSFIYTTSPLWAFPLFPPPQLNSPWLCPPVIWGSSLSSLSLAFTHNSHSLPLYLPFLNKSLSISWVPFCPGLLPSKFSVPFSLWFTAGGENKWRTYWLMMVSTFLLHLFTG